MIIVRSRIQHQPPESAFTIAEVVIAMAIGTLALAGIINGYIMSAHRAEWSAYNLAAQSLANQRVEQARSAKWDPLGYPAVDELVAANFPATVDVLDVPISTNGKITYATNTTTITTLGTNPSYKMVRVDCTWMFMGRGVFTNTVITYRAPDQ